jgi:hypothetical protein
VVIKREDDSGLYFRRGNVPPPTMPLSSSERLERARGTSSVGRREAGPPQPRPFACALFSDGRLQLDVGGAGFTLLPTETTRLIRYLSRMADDVKEAA